MITLICDGEFTMKAKGLSKKWSPLIYIVKYKLYKFKIVYIKARLSCSNK